MTIDLRSFLPSVLRTFVPLIVGYFAAWPVAGLLGLREDQITALVTVVVTALYYALVRVLETYVEPNFGWLLGWAGRPVYPLPVDAGASGGAVGDVARVLKRDDSGQASYDLVWVLIVLALLVSIFLKVYGVV